MLDLPTLFAVLALAYLANLVFSVALFVSGNDFPGARLWLLAQSVTAVGTLGLAAREVLPYPLLALANTALFSALLVYAHSAWRFRSRRPFPVIAYGVVPLFFLTLWLLGGQSIPLRVIIYNGAQAPLAFIVFGLFVVRTKPIYRQAAWITGVPFALIGIGNLYQVGNAALTTSAGSLGQLGPGYAIVILISILTAAFSLFGYFMLAGVRKQKILERKSQRLRDLNRNLQKSNQTKDLFVSMLAHDLKGPIAGAARYVRKHLLPDHIDLTKKQAALEILAASLEKTFNFLDNVLWWSRAQREDWASNRRRFDLRDCASDVLKVHQPVATAKGLTLEAACQPAEVFADFDSVELILHNLVSNAIKFSYPDGQVDLETGIDHRGRPFVRVTDRGTGIPAELREKLFQIESKVVTEGTQGERGTGMGLILCWEFARLNEATLMLTSEPGLGTTVILSFTPAGERS